MLAFHIEANVKQLRTVLETCSVKCCSAWEVNRDSERKASSVVAQRITAVALASAPSPQEGKSWNTGKTGLFPSFPIPPV